MIARGNLIRVYQALSALGKNRLPLTLTQIIHDAKACVLVVIKHGKELHQALIEQYDSTGKGWDSLTEAPPELVSKIMALNSQLVDIDMRGSINVIDLPKDVLLDEASYDILTQVGFLK